MLTNWQTNQPPPQPQQAQKPSKPQVRFKQEPKERVLDSFQKGKR